MRGISWIGLLALTFFLTAAASAEVSAEVTECDRLAANPPDPDRVTEGVPRSQIDLSTAIDACKTALAAEPDVARFAYQLGRVYFYDGDVSQALNYMGRSADQGYRQAEFVMGALINNRREGVIYDICKVEDYWVRSARSGHLHAGISYVRHTTKGYFDACDLQASDEELSQFMDVESTGSADYFLRLLVEDLKEDLAAYLP